MSTLERAIALASEAHEGQVDRGGTPYILHPLHVMQNVHTEQERIVAVLHDIVEDTPWTIPALRRQGFSEEVLDAIAALTKRKGESRFDAARRTAANPIARVVKLQDVLHNLDISRMPFEELESEKTKLRVAEYRVVTAILKEAIYMDSWAELGQNRRSKTIPAQKI